MSTTSQTYEFRVSGHLDDHWAEWLGGVSITRNEDGTTTLTGEVADQARLHGILAGLRDIGASLLSVQSRGVQSHGTLGATTPSALSEPL
jgi:hypothetical protein